MNKNVSIAVGGATGVVGREIIAALLEREVPSEQLTLFASERNEGDELDYGDDTLPIEQAKDDSFRGIKLALFAVPADAARRLVPPAQQAGAAVIDCSPAFRSTFALALPGVTELANLARALACPGAPAAMLATI